MSASLRGALREAAERASRGEAFVLATVVGRGAPSSARPAQRAIILPDGTLRGFLGGSCIEPVVRKEALEALAEARPRRVVLAPEGAAGTGAGPASSEPDVHSHPMTCHSGGSVEIFLEPCLPAPVLDLYGDSPVIGALEAMAEPLGWVVRRRRAPGPGDGDADPSGDGPPRAAVVATMGVWDEEAAGRALAEGAPWVGLVASPRRTGEVRRRLAERGVPAERLERLVGPAGLDLGAETPAEIAVSILAEMVERHLATAPADAEAAAAPPEGSAGPGREEHVTVDPVCGMEVDPATSRVTLVLDGTVYHFCCEGCRDRFRADPAAYGAAGAAGG
ncbi:MAG TPA: XdhC family protein [Gemmatimonadota bacterium]|nr:XdhC family protein [Gemmatimonadota bacterium]